MKKLFFSLATVLLCAAFGQAQTVQDEVALIQSAFGLEKEALVREAMQLSPDKADAFWTVYRQYEEERRTLARNRMGIIAEYIDKYNTLTDADAMSLAQRTVKADMAVSKLHSKYLKRFAKATTPTEAAKFLQLDRHIHAAVRLMVSDNLPFLVEK